MSDRLQYFAENMDRLTRRDRVFLNNPVVMQGLGIAPIVIPATNIRNAVVLAFAVLLLLTPTRMLATFIGQRVGLKSRAVVYVLTAGLFYVVVSYFVDYIFAANAVNVGIYLPLLVVEPLILKRYESPKRERLATSFKKGMITTIGFCLVLFMMSGIRELLATGQLGGVEIFRGSFLPMAEMPAGGFLLLGIFVAVWRALVSAFKKRVTQGVNQPQ